MIEFQDKIDLTQEEWKCIVCGEEVSYFLLELDGKLRFQQVKSQFAPFLQNVPVTFHGALKYLLACKCKIPVILGQCIELSIDNPTEQLQKDICEIACKILCKYLFDILECALRLCTVRSGEQVVVAVVTPYAQKVNEAAAAHVRECCKERAMKRKLNYPGKPDEVVIWALMFSVLR